MAITGMARERLMPAGGKTSRFWNKSPTRIVNSLLYNELRGYDRPLACLLREPGSPRPKLFLKSKVLERFLSLFSGSSEMGGGGGGILKNLYNIPRLF
jgi:hypothetical protein